MHSFNSEQEERFKVVKETLTAKNDELRVVIKEYEELQVAYLQSKLTLEIGDVVSINGVEYIYGGYYLSNSRYHTLSMAPRIPSMILYKIKSDKERYKNFFITTQYQSGFINMKYSVKE